MSEKIMRVSLRIGFWLLMVITAIIAVLFVIRISGAESRAMESAAVQPALYWTYILLAIATFFAVIFPVIFIIRNPKKAIKALISLLILGVIVLVAYLLADATPIVTATSATNPDFSDRGVLLLSDTGLRTTYILICVAILMLLFTGVRSIIRNR